MTTLRISEAINITASQTQQILQDARIQMGFEAEMILPQHVYGEDESQAERKFEVELKQRMGSVVNSWDLVPDGSIAPDPQTPGTGVELVTSPAQIRTSLAHMRVVFEMMTAKQIQTNITTGLHVGLSMKGAQIAHVNKLKLLMLLDEQFVSDAFDRTFNSYTQSHVQRLKDQIQKAQRMGHKWIRSRMIQDLITQLESRIDLKKHRTVNFGKLSQGYLEFRIMGNEDYHKQYDQVQYFVIRYAAVLKAALDPEAFEAEYEQQAARLISQALNEVKPEYKHLTHKYAVLGAGAPEVKHAQRYDRLEKALVDGNQKAAVVLLSMLIQAADKHADVTTNPRLINASALAYRILLKKHLNLDVKSFVKLMKTHHVPDATIQRVKHYLITY